MLISKTTWKSSTRFARRMKKPQARSRRILEDKKPTEILEWSTPLDVVHLPKTVRSRAKLCQASEILKWDNPSVFWLGQQRRLSLAGKQLKRHNQKQYRKNCSHSNCVLKPLRLHWEGSGYALATSMCSGGIIFIKKNWAHPTHWLVFFRLTCPSLYSCLSHVCFLFFWWLASLCSFFLKHIFAN